MRAYKHYFLLFGMVFLPTVLDAGTYSVNNKTDLNTTLNTIMLSSDTTESLTFTSSFSLAGTNSISIVSTPIGTGKTNFVIDGGGHTIDGGGEQQAFFIGSLSGTDSMNVTIRNLTMTDCLCQGGNTIAVGQRSGGGGGGLGAGGAIFVDSNVIVTLENVTIQGCQAIGGKSSDCYSVAPYNTSDTGGGGGYGGGDLSPHNPSSNPDINRGGGGGGGFKSIGSYTLGGGGGGGGPNIRGGEPLDFSPLVGTTYPYNNQGGIGGMGSQLSATTFQIDIADQNIGGRGGFGLNGIIGGTGGLAATTIGGTVSGGIGGNGGLYGGGGGGGGKKINVAGLNGGDGGDGGTHMGGGGGGGGVIGTGSGAAGNGGAGGRFSGGGGGGGSNAGTTSGGGGDGGAFGGGGGAGNARSGVQSFRGGNGGFGGGGGGAGIQSAGQAGDGGFGGGGGGGCVTPGGYGGAFAGDGAFFSSVPGGNSFAGGGGGAGLGGAIFVNQGGSLILGASVSFSANSVLGGLGGTLPVGIGQAGQDGLGAGADIFLYDGGLSIATGEVVSIPAGNIGVYSGTCTFGSAGNTGRLLLTGITPMQTQLAGASPPQLTNFSGDILINYGSFSYDVGAIGTATLIIGANAQLALLSTGTYTDNYSFAGGLDIDPTAGTITLTPGSGNTYTGETIVSSGTLATGNTGALSASSNFTVNAALTVAHTSEIGSLSGSAGGLITINNSVSLTTTAGSDTTYAGSISGPGAFTKAGTGTLVLSGVNTNTGITTINGGAISLASPNTLGGGGNVVLNGASTALLVSTGGSLANSISGSGGLTKTGVGTLTLAGTNTYSGITTISGGALAATNSGLSASSSFVVDADFFVLQSGSIGTLSSTGSDGVITLGATLTTVANTDTTYAGSISGPGSFYKTGTGTLILSGTNSFSGGTTLHEGAISVATSLGTGDITFDGGGLIAIGAGEIAGNFIGTGTFTKNNPGTIVLSGTNTSFHGTISVNDGGVVQASFGDNLGDGVISLSATSSLAMTNGGLTTVANAIVGDGSMTITGGGNFTLEGSNTFSGGLTVGLGLISVADGSSLGSGNVVLTNSADDIIALAGTTTIANNISGSGGMRKNGGGTLTLTGSNSYTGSTDVNTGTLSISDSNALGGGGIVRLDLFGSLLVSTGMTLSNNITSLILVDEGVTKTGGGTLILEGTNSFTGGLTVTGGGVSVAKASSLGSGNVVLTNADNDLTVTAGMTFPFVISGNGTVMKTGTGTLTLSGANTFSGGLTVSGGSVSVAVGSRLGSGDVVLTNLGSNLTITDDTTVPNNIIGTGTLSKTGLGALALTGTGSTFTGGITVSGGSVSIADGVSLGTGDVTLVGAGNDLTVTAATTVSNNIVGTGTMTKTGSGAAILSGTGSTFTGGITVSGGSVSIANGASLGTGDVTLDGTGTALTVTAATTVSNNIVGSGTMTKTGSGAAILSGAGNTFTGGITVSGGSVSIANGAFLGTGDVTLVGAGNDLTVTAATTVSNNIVGTGTMTKTGSGAVTLSGAGSTFTGGITVSGGSVSIANGASLGTGDVTLVGTSNDLTVTAATTVPNNIVGTGTMTKTGSGAVTLSGAGSTFTGGITVSGGSVSIANGASLGTGDVTLVGTSNDLTVTAATTVPNNIVGTGTMTKTGSGAVTLSGAGNTFTGGITVSGGSVSIANGAFLGTGDVTLVGAGNDLTVTAATTVSNNIIGTGTMTKTGSGALSLTGSNSYTGVTTISGGSLTIADSAAVGGGGGIALGSGTSLGVTAAMTLPNVISGAGSLTKSGAGTLTLPTANTFTGSATVSAGAIEVTDASALATPTSVVIGNGTTLQMNAPLASIKNPSGSGTLAAVQSFTINSTTDTTFSGVISGAAAIEKAQSGKLSLTGTSSYTGTLTVSSGQLALGGRLASSTVHATGGVVSGNGTFGNLTLTGSSACKPGASIGTMNVAGNYSLGSGTTLEIEFNGSGDTDLVNVTGSASIDSGATLELVPLPPGPYVDGTTYTFLSTGSGITGEFGTVTLTDDTYFDSYSINIVGNDYILTLGETINGGPAVQTQTQIVDLIGDLSFRASNIQMRNLMAINNARWYESSRCSEMSDKKKGFEFFGISSLANGVYKPYGNNSQYPGGRYTISGTTIGGGYVFAPYNAFGFMGGYTYGKLTSYPTHTTNVHTKTYSIGMRGQWQPYKYIGFDITENLDFTNYWINTRRCCGRSIEAKTHGFDNSLQGRIRGDFCFKKIKVQPYVGGYWTYLYVNPFDQQGLATDAYHIPKQTDNLFFGDFGLCLSTNFRHPSGGIFTPFIELEQYVQWIDKEQTLETSRLDGNRDFTIVIPPYENELFQAGGGIMYHHDCGITAYIMANAVLGNGQKDSWEGSFGFAYTY